MIRRPPRSTPLYSSAASDVYKRQHLEGKVLRHALVKVSMGPGQQNSQELKEKDKVDEDIDSESSISENN